MKKTWAQKKADEIKKTTAVSVSYLETLKKGAESSYNVWLSLNEESATGTEITTEKVGMLNKKLEYQKQIIDETKTSYEEIKKLLGEFSAESIKAKENYIDAYNSYMEIIADKNFAINDNNQSIRKAIDDQYIKQQKEAEKQNKEIDKKNKAKFGVTAKTVDNNDYTYIREVVENYNQFIKEHQEMYTSTMGASVDEFLDFAKKVTGFDKIEENYLKGITGGNPHLIPYVEEPALPDYDSPEIVKASDLYKDGSLNIPDFEGVYQRDVLSILNNTSSLINEEMYKSMEEAGENGIKGMLEGMSEGIIKNEEQLRLIGKNFAEKITATLAQDVKNVVNNYQSNYNISSNGESLESQLESAERYEELKQMRGSE